MSEHLFPRAYARCARWLCALVCLSALAAVSGAQSLPAGSPVLLTEGTGQTTRAVAYEAVTFRSEPFPVVSPVNWNADKSNTRDQQTRVMLFATGLQLLAGEGANALTADAQDASGRIYPLKVEALTKPPYDIFDVAGKQHTGQPQDWLWAITLRLDEQMTDTLGDVLVRINLHGLSSNRVRIAIGQASGGIATDSSTEFISPAPATTPTPTTPLTPKAYGPGEASTADVTRLLEQATWGPTTSEVTRVQQQLGLRAFIDEQFNAQVLNTTKGSDYPDLTLVADDSNTTCPSTLSANERTICLRDNYSIYPLQVQFFKNALTRPTQLRQRVAFALHQIFVVSNVDIPLPWWMNGYVQTLDRNALGNYRTLLGEMTLNPAMGEYLNMNQSTAGNPNENYAREVLQLFSTGVNSTNHDGTPVLDAQGQPVPVYTQSDINEFTKVFTGWRFAPALQVGNPPAGATNYRDPMVPRNSTTHDTTVKNLFGTQVHDCANGTSGSNNGLCAQSELTQALDVIFNHPNVGPFVSRQLIQHLVTSNPSPAYVARVADAFDNDCAGLYPENPCLNQRGNLKAVVRNILLDPEARGDVKTDPSYGRLREPVQYINNFLRAFNATSDGVLAQGTSGTVGDAPTAMGQPLFRPATVFSYYEPDYQVTGTRLTGPAFQILTTSTTLRRANWINQLLYFGLQPAQPNVPTGTQIQMAPVIALADNPSGMVDYLNNLLLHGTMSAAMRQTVLDAINAIPNTSSDYQRRRAQTAIYLVATSAQYEVQR